MLSIVTFDKFKRNELRCYFFEPKGVIAGVSSWEIFGHGNGRLQGKWTAWEVSGYRLNPGWLAGCLPHRMPQLGGWLPKFFLVIWSPVACHGQTASRVMPRAKYLFISLPHVNCHCRPYSTVNLHCLSKSPSEISLLYRASNLSLKNTTNTNYNPQNSRTQRYLLTYLLTYSLTPWCRTLFEKLIVIQLVKKYPAFFMEPEGSSQCSQKPATGSYPEPAEFISPHRYLSSHLRLGLPSGLLPSGFPIKTL
jgi:hypothetical protein